jgi:hypothetical protein
VCALTSKSRSDVKSFFRSCGQEQQKIDFHLEQANFHGCRSPPEMVTERLAKQVDRKYLATAETMVAEDNWNDRNHPNAEREAKQKFGRPFIAAKRWLRTCTRFIVLHDPARVVSARSGVSRDASKPRRPAFPLFRGLPSIV